MDTVYEIAIRVFGYTLIFVLLFVRSGIPHPLYNVLIQGSAFDKWVQRTRLVIPWRLFCGIGPRYHDIEVIAVASDGETHRRSLLNDHDLFGLALKSGLTRLTWVYYFRQYPAVWQGIREQAQRHLQSSGKVMQELVIRFHLYDSLDDSKDPAPLKTEILHQWIRPPQGGDAR